MKSAKKMVIVFGVVLRGCAVNKEGYLMAAMVLLVEPMNMNAPQKNQV